MADSVFRHAEEDPTFVPFKRRSNGGWVDVTAAEFAKQVSVVAKGLIASGAELGDRDVVPRALGTTLSAMSLLPTFSKATHRACGAFGCRVHRDGWPPRPLPRASCRRVLVTMRGTLAIKLSESHVRLF